jgi:hypothetical protein
MMARPFVLAFVTGVVIAGCKGGGGYTQPEMHSIGGSVTGLHGTGLVLANNGGGNLSVPQSAGTFSFATTVANGTAFNVTVATQPTGPSQTCVVAHGSGTISGTDVTNVAVTCTDDGFTIGGTVTGLVASGLSLALDMGGGFLQNVAVPAAGPYNYTFPNAVPSGTHYAVSVATTPTNPPQGCSVSHASGTVGSAGVTDIVVSCDVTVEQLLVVGDANDLTGHFVDPSTGALASSSGASTPLGADFGNLTIDSSRHFVYTAIHANGGPGEVGQYRISPNDGTLINIAVPLTKVSSDVSDVITTPNGKFAYALSNVDTWAFNRDPATGVLTLLSPGTSQVLIPASGWGGTPIGIAGFVDASSSFVYYRVNLMGCSCYVLGGFAIDAATGTLTSIGPGGSFSSNANGLGAIEPQGRYLLFAGRQQVGAVMQDSIATYSINASTGALTQLSAVARPSGEDLTGLAIHPNGKFLYVTDGENVWGYSIDAGTGALASDGVVAVNTATDVSGRGVIRGMAFDPSAQWLYVGNRSAKTVAELAVDANTGNLTLVPGSPLVLAGDIRRIVASRIP